MSEPEPVAYFGYGSLVTSETRPPHTKAHPVTLCGWVRQWKHCVEITSGKCCALTVTKRPMSQIDGVVILDRMDTIDITDRREIGYYREPIEIDASCLPAEFQGIPIFTYVSMTPYYRWGDEHFPIWRTYLDCVLAGFIREFGRTGAARFIRSTEGWDRCPILDDRDNPRYSRKVNLSSIEEHLIEELLRENCIAMPGRHFPNLSV